ncbi:hypothetical protein KCP70_12560 [Salmonella enterica subsp. enterica]|nr:hypothetical protein KCP70_12560 [Salmonella enterica subsp. enterica]
MLNACRVTYMHPEVKYHRRPGDGGRGRYRARLTALATSGEEGAGRV